MTDVAAAFSVRHDNYGGIVLPAVTYHRRVHIRVDGELGRFGFRLTADSVTDLGANFTLLGNHAPVEFILPAGQAIYLDANDTRNDTALVNVIATLASPDEVVT